MASQVAISMFVLRIIAMAASAATIALLVTNNANLEVAPFHFDLIKFQHVIAFRYVVAVAAISALYGIIQLPFAMYYAVKEKRLIRNGCLPDFDFIADKVISLLLATAIGVGIGVSYEFKRDIKEDNSSEFPDIEASIVDEIISKINKFYERGIVASSVLALACLCMAIVSVISSINRSRSKGGLFK